MGIDVNNLWEELLAHYGHDVRIDLYGGALDPKNVALTCETCGEVLLDANQPVLPRADQEEFDLDDDEKALEKALDAEIAETATQVEEIKAIRRLTEAECKQELGIDVFSPLPEEFAQMAGAPVAKWQDLVRDTRKHGFVFSSDSITSDEPKETKKYDLAATGWPASMQAIVTKMVEDTTIMMPRGRIRGLFVKEDAQEIGQTHSNCQLPTGETGTMTVVEIFGDAGEGLVDAVMTMHAKLGPEKETPQGPEDKVDPNWRVTTPDDLPKKADPSVVLVLPAAAWRLMRRQSQHLKELSSCVIHSYGDDNHYVVKNRIGTFLPKEEKLNDASMLAVVLSNTCPPQQQVQKGRKKADV